jgi:hypothetical protein
VEVLLRVYAKCISGQQDEAKRRIEEATRIPEDQWMIKNGSRQTWARIGHRDPDTGTRNRIQPPMTRADKITNEPGSSQFKVCFRWWWQVQGSNLGRLSRRFYRWVPLLS